MVIKGSSTLVCFCVSMAMAITAILGTRKVEGAINETTWKTISRMNKGGPFFGLVVPNSFEMSPLFRSSSFVPNPNLPFLDYGGRRFHFGVIGNKKVVMVMTGLSMLNAGLSTQLLLDLFNVEGVLHFGIAGNADPNLQIGDVTVPRFWAHTGLWNWQRFGEGPNDPLALEDAGDYNRDIGYLNFSSFEVGEKGKSLLSNVWYQPEEVFPVNGVPELRQHAFWVPVNPNYYTLSKKLQGMELQGCVNSTTCLDRKPVVARVKAGCSANTFVDNAAYRQFLRSKFQITAIDMETAAVALVCLQREIPFIAFRALSDLAGGGGSMSNEAAIFGSLAAENAASAVTKFVSLLH